ncbi:PD-(D/E)XK nuclease family protein [Empedobacter sp. ULE_I145]|uniref:PD-(D/E)XK nuclease family protein n=1 Tax=Empedobacter sp. R132-2 TaxID=2746740 RepID=UPI002574E6F0|nr:PD-(D/E)XK nuclease family protein [Empedobacter sp. R132-2]MDM1137830.1 PD-(D/E)XK nuclease family protein [Empedobacter sp. R132-2]
MVNKKPNIFNIATKELHQDAFITWLIQYADNECKILDNNLNNCAKEFIIQLIQKKYPEFNEDIENVFAGRQRNNIDVWAEINNKYFIIIEDKTNTAQHSDQLSRYKKIAEKYTKDKNYKEPICIYLKTGNESENSLRSIINQGYHIYNRQDFLYLLNSHQEINNNIFLDFKERLLKLEKSNNEFENKKLKNWKSEDWQGFFQFLEKEIDVINWNYVNNPSGGFWNAVLTWDQGDICPVYIQLEQDKLCFKVSTHPQDTQLPEGINRTEARNSLYHLIMEESKKRGFNEIKKPIRFGNGNYMTSAVVEKQNWLGNDEDIIDKSLVISNITKYTKFLKEII